MDWQALAVHLSPFHVAITSMPMGQLHRTLQGMPFLISIPARHQLMVPKVKNHLWIFMVVYCYSKWGGYRNAQKLQGYLEPTLDTIVS